MIKISRPPNKKKIKSPSLFPLKITEKEHDYIKLNNCSKTENQILI